MKMTGMILQPEFSECLPVNVMKAVIIKDFMEVSLLSAVNFYVLDIRHASKSTSILAIQCG